MPVTRLDPVAALIVIDLQKGVAGLPSAHPIAAIVERSAQLARAFRHRSLPVVLVNVTGVAPGRTAAARNNLQLPGDWTHLLPELDPQPSDHLVTKQRVGAFIGTSLHEYLQDKRVTQVLLTGVATSLGVEATARSAYDYGYNVVLVTDAMTDLDTGAHLYCIEKIFPRLGELDTTEGVLKLLGA